MRACEQRALQVPAKYLITRSTKWCDRSCERALDGAWRMVPMGAFCKFTLLFLQPAGLGSAGHLWTLLRARVRAFVFRTCAWIHKSGRARLQTRTPTPILISSLSLSLSLSLSVSLSHTLTHINMTVYIQVDLRHKTGGC